MSAITYATCKIDPACPGPCQDHISHAQVIFDWLHGGCTFLADALSELTGWEVVFVAPPGQLTYGHAMARRPDGTLVDFRGAHAPDVDPRLHFPVEISGNMYMPTPSLLARFPDLVPDVEVVPVTPAHREAWEVDEEAAAPWRRDARRVATRLLELIK